MARQMHQLDDDSADPSSRFSQEAGARERPKTAPRPEARLDETPLKNLGPLRPEASLEGERPSFWRSSNREDTTIGAGADHKKSSTVGNATWQVLSTVVSIGVIAATLFTIWMPGSLMPGSLEQRMVNAVSSGEQLALTPTPAASMPSDFPSNKIGLVVGHMGNDSGAVCVDGLTELEVNSNVATFAQQALIEAGYEVELLEEFDPRLSNYEAGLLLSIHADSCEYINDSATGFKVAAALSETKRENSSRLVACMADRYAAVTGLKYHYQSVTTDMTYYHAFNEISPYTTAAIIEVGFLNLDKDLLRTKPDLVAEGIVAGVQCYMNNEGVGPAPAGN